MAYSKEEPSSLARSALGEDYESDEEICQELCNSSYKEAQVTKGVSHGIVISGEASESDEEIESRAHSGIPPSGSDFSISESWNKQSVDGSEKSESQKEEHIKYNTLLHRKLRERNQSLRKNLIEMACQPYQSASKEIHSISQQLIKSQILVQEVASTLRRLTNELFVLENRVQSIKNGSFIPDMDLTSIPPIHTP